MSPPISALAIFPPPTKQSRRGGLAIEPASAAGAAAPIDSVGVIDVVVVDRVFEADMSDRVGEGFIRARVWRVAGLTWLRCWLRCWLR